MLNPLPVVVADMRRTWPGVVAVVLFVALAVALGVAVSAQERALRRGSAHAADRFDIVVGAPGSETQLVLTTVYLQPTAVRLIPGALLTRLQADPGVALAAPVAFGDYHRSHPLVGTTAAFAGLGGAPADGRMFAKMGEAVIGADVPFDLGYRFHPRHGQELPGIEDEEDHDHDHDHEHEHDHGTEAGHDEHVHTAIEYTVVGRLPRQGTPWDRAIIVPVEAMWFVHGLLPAPADAAKLEPAAFPISDRFAGEALPGVPAIVVKPTSIGDAYRLRGALRTGETMAVFPGEVLVALYETLGDARAVLSAVASGTQVLVIGAILLAVFASLATRRRPLAVLRALGASRAYVFSAVWLHVTAMVALGGLLGLGLGYVGAAMLSRVFELRTGLTLPVALSGNEVAMVGILLLAGGVLALIPAAAVYRQSVTAALRS